jgi:hypothetical protein
MNARLKSFASVISSALFFTLVGCSDAPQESVRDSETGGTGGGAPAGGTAGAAAGTGGTSGSSGAGGGGFGGGGTSGGAGGSLTGGTGGGGAGGTAAGGTAAGGTAGGGAGGDGAGGSAGGSVYPATFQTAKDLFTSNYGCTGSDCHGGNSHTVKLLVNPDLYTTLTTHVSKACGNLKVVEPGQPENSALIKILKGPCGLTPRMPYGCMDDSCVEPDVITALEQWIAAGAPMN